MCRGIYVVSFAIGTVFVLFLFADLCSKYMAQPKGINQEFVTHEPMPFPELNLCRYLVGLSRSQLKKYNVSAMLTKALHWRLEVNYSPGFLPEAEVREMLTATKEEYENLKKTLNFQHFYQVIRAFLPQGNLTGHPTKAIIYRKPTNSYMEMTAEENWLITYVEDLYLYNAICHAIELKPDSEDYFTDVTKNYQLLPIARSFLLMDGNYDPIARIEPGRKYWGNYKLKSSHLMSSSEHPCREQEGYQQQKCVQTCFGKAVQASPNCSHCQSVFMHVNFSAEAGEPDICDPWQYLACNSTNNQIKQGQAVVNCMESCILACHDMSFEYTVTSVAEDPGLSAHVGWRNDFFEISENRSIFILSPSRRPNKHIRIRQYSIVDLASVFGDVGGYLGLFLGSSVLTLVHVILFWSRKCMLRPAAAAYRKRVSRTTATAATSITASPTTVSADPSAATGLLNHCERHSDCLAHRDCLVPPDSLNGGFGGREMVHIRCSTREETC